jgi:hypothetical protein
MHGDPRTRRRRTLMVLERRQGPDCRRPGARLRKRIALSRGRHEAGKLSV